MNPRKIRIVSMAVLLLLTLAFIFSNSLLPVAQSQEKSLGVMEIVKPVLEFFVGKGAVTDHLVRKLAHFTEFLILGIILTLLCVQRRRPRLQNVLICLSFGLAAAVIDESLQMLTDRAPMLADVLLDFSGVFSGVLITLILYQLFSTCKKGWLPFVKALKKRKG
jgi:VanZ family protein